MIQKVIISSSEDFFSLFIWVQTEYQSTDYGMIIDMNSSRKTMMVMVTIYRPNRKKRIG